MERPPILPVVFATGFGSGFWPWGPGTAGALVAVLVWMGLSFVLAPMQLLVSTALLVVAFTLIGWWATDRLMPYWGEDPSRVVVDEMVGMWIALLPVPVVDWRFVVAAFLLFRFFDIVKPLGIRALDRKQGGFWVMADDILAGLYSAAIILLVLWVR